MPQTSQFPVVTSVTDTDKVVVLASGTLSTITVANTANKIGSTVPPSDWTIILGDSLAIGSDVRATDTQVLSWFSALCKMSGGRIQHMHNAGISSETTTQMLARIQTDVIAKAPGWCILAVCSPNNSNFGVSLTQAKIDIAAMVTALNNAGIRPILCTGLPTSNTYNTYNLYVAELSHWAAAYAVKNGIPLFDLHTPNVDATTGNYIAANTTDGVHLTTVGTLATAAYQVSRIPAEFGRGPYLTTGLYDAGNLVTNGAFGVDTNSDGLADNWTKESGTVTLTRSAMSAAEGFGYWQVATLTGTNAVFLYNTISTGFAVGDVLEYTGKFLCDVNMNVHAIIDKMPSNVTFGSPLTTWATAVAGTPYVWQCRCTVPSGATSLQARIAAGGYQSGVVKWGQVTVRNLTALGQA